MLQSRLEGGVHTTGNRKEGVKIKLMRFLFKITAVSSKQIKALRWKLRERRNENKREKQ